MNANVNNFWQYSVAFYREPGITEACLKLQNQHGFDVNLVLFCLWYGLNRGLLPVPLLQQALVFAKKHVEVLLQGGCPGAELALSKAKDDKKGSASKAEASPDVPAKPSKGAGKRGVDKYENAYSTVSDTDLANAYVALAEVERLVSCRES